MAAGTHWDQTCHDADTMPIVHLPEALRKYADGQRSAAVAGATVTQALTAAAAAHPDLDIRLFDDRGRVHRHLAIICRDEAIPSADLTTTAVGPDEGISVLIAVSGGQIVA
jgi:hypothetical protein